MIVLPRSVVRQFRLAARRCSPSRPHGPASPVAVLASPQGATLFTNLGSVALELIAPTGSGRGRLVVPTSVLAAVEGPGDDPVEFTVQKGQGVARWSDRGGPHELAFETDLTGSVPDPPERPRRWASVPDAFPAAMHEAARTAARETGRYALDRVQFRAAVGQIVATDSHQALVQGGFRFPFPTDLLIPAVGVFALAELWPAPLRLGRAGDRLVVVSPLATVWLSVDPEGRFPDVLGAIPTRPAPTTIAIAETDRAALLAALSTGPGTKADPTPVTLDAAPGRLVVRVQPDEGAPVEATLATSTVSGPAVRVALDRRHLGRALALGLTSVRLAGPDRPIVFADATRTYLAVALEPVSCHPSEEPLMRPASNPPALANGRTHPPVDDLPDPLAEAEGLRSALADAASRAARLIAALRARRKETRALTQVYSSLKALNLGPGSDR